jgi:hypothetical protein
LSLRERHRQDSSLVNLDGRWPMLATATTTLHDAGPLGSVWESIADPTQPPVTLDALPLSHALGLADVAQGAQLAQLAEELDSCGVVLRTATEPFDIQPTYRVIAPNHATTTGVCATSGKVDAGRPTRNGRARVETLRLALADAKRGRA